MSDLQRGDRVVYTGPVVNETWDPALAGTVIGITGDPVRSIDIRWDNGACNSGHNPADFRLVDGDQLVTEGDAADLDDDGDELKATPYQPTWWWDCPRCREVNETQTDSLDPIEQCRECSAKVRMRS